MLEILTKAGCYIAIILLGYFLRKIKFLPEQTFDVLAKISLSIALPAAVIANTAGKEIQINLLAIAALGIGCGLVLMILIYLLHIRHSREEKAFQMLNVAGYNIGNFAMPFTQSFLGPMGMLTCSLFDIGNAFICLGGAFGIASAMKEGKGFSLLKILKAPLRSVPFVVYVLMAILNLLGWSLPRPVISLAEIIGSSNAFLAMLMIGVGFKLSGDREQIGKVVKILGLRYGVGAVLALIFYFVLPFDVEIRQALVLLVFSPIGSAIPAFTGKLGGDTGLSSAINSISIVCSIVFMVVLLIIML
jgi:predicted permease